MADEQQQLEPLSPEMEQLELLPKAEPERQYCLFRAGRERFCFSVLDVEEVVEWPNLTKVPLAPSFLMAPPFRSRRILLIIWRSSRHVMSSPSLTNSPCIAAPSPITAL